MIYHFTSIETLSLILKHRQMKFSRLDCVNDPLDGFSSGYIESQKMAYVACFTRREDDSIPMWSLYTRDFRGVRIGFPENIFGEVEQNKFDLKIRKTDQNVLNNKSSYIAGPEDIIYKNTIDEIDREILIEKVNNHGRQFGKANYFNPFIVGKLKLNDWKFEKECRFIIFAIDYKFVSGIDNGSSAKRLKDIKSIISKNPKELYVKFNEEIFSQVEILLGPMANESDRLIVESLVTVHAPTIKKVDKSKKRIVQKI